MNERGLVVIVESRTAERQRRVDGGHAYAREYQEYFEEAARLKWTWASCASDMEVDPQKNHLQAA